MPDLCKRSEKSAEKYFDLVFVEDDASVAG
jgi:hypothetical protein